MLRFVLESRRMSIWMQMWCSRSEKTCETWKLETCVCQCCEFNGCDIWIGFNVNISIDAKSVFEKFLMLSANSHNFLWFASFDHHCFSILCVNPVEILSITCCRRCPHSLINHRSLSHKSAEHNSRNNYYEYLLPRSNECERWFGGKTEWARPSN